MAIEKTSIKSTEVSFTSNVTVADNEQENLTSIGIDPGQSFRFGKVEPNANYTKYIDLDAAKYSEANLRSEGNISEVLEYGERHVIEPNESRRVRRELFAHSEGFYRGEIILTVRNSRNALGEYWLTSPLSRLS